MIEQRETRDRITDARQNPGATRGAGRAARQIPAPSLETRCVVPPLLPVLLPVVIAAIVTGLLFAWWFPPTPSGAVAPAVRFTDVTAEAGLLGWSPPESGETPTTLGGGVVCFDYDNDGHDDLLFVGGARWPWEEGMAKRVGGRSVALFRNDGTGKFRDATVMAGLNIELQGMSAAAGDFDSDGLTDVFVTGVGANHLFRNIGRGRFEDVTESAGVTAAENTWTTGATWIDFDGDGKLDLVAAHYARWSREVDLRMAFLVANVGHSYGAPAGFIGMFPSVYRNLGDGRFALVPNSAGLRDVDRQTGFPVAKALTVVPVDVNDDGRLDLMFSYHRHDGSLFINQGDGRFGLWSGRSDRRQEGVAAGLVSAGLLPLQSEGGDERLAAWRAAMAVDDADEVNGVALRAKHGAALLDYDLDGRLDVFLANGRAEVDTNRFEEGREFARAPELIWNGGQRWLTAPMAEDAALPPLTARGVAVSDFDADGDLDVVIAQHGAGPRLLRNDQRESFPWLQVKVVATRGTREAPGARVEVHTPRRVQVQTVAPAMSYMAQSTATLTFGLGDDARVRKVVVQWPSGRRQEVRPEAVNRRMVITEP